MHRIFRMYQFWSAIAIFILSLLSGLGLQILIPQTPLSGVIIIVLGITLSGAFFIWAGFLYSRTRKAANEHPKLTQELNFNSTRSGADFFVVPWGAVSTEDIWNAVNTGQMVQNRLHFQIGDSIPLKVSAYSLKHGGYDLDRAAGEKARVLMSRYPGEAPIILVTSYQYSEPGMFLKGISGQIDNCYFLKKVPRSNRLFIISYWAWDSLDPNPELTVLKPTGHRRIWPILLYSFATIALLNKIQIAFHEKTWGCPFDECFHVKDIDQFFINSRYCPECSYYLRSKLSGKKDRFFLDDVNAMFVASTGIHNASMFTDRSET